MTLANLIVVDTGQHPAQNVLAHPQDSLQITRTCAIAQVHVFGKTMHARKNQVRSGSKYVILLACSENGTLCVIMLLKLLLSLVPLCLSTLPGVGRVIGETKANLRTFMSLFLSLVIRCEPVSGGVLWHIAEAICQHIWS